MIGHVVPPSVFCRVLSFLPRHYSVPPGEFNGQPVACALQPLRVNRGVRARPRGIAGSLIALQTQINAAGRRRSVKFRVELVWTDNEENDASSIFLTSDGRVVLQGRGISPLERQALALPADGEMISVDRNLIRAIKDML
jgi:hypothetical protein